MTLNKKPRQALAEVFSFSKSAFVQFALVKDVFPHKWGKENGHGNDLKSAEKHIEREQELGEE